MNNLRSTILIGAGANMEPMRKKVLVDQCVGIAATLALELGSERWVQVIAFDATAYEYGQLSTDLPSTHNVGSSFRFGPESYLPAGIHAALSNKAREERMLVVAIADCHKLTGVSRAAALMQATPDAFLMLGHVWQSEYRPLIDLQVPLERQPNIALAHLVPDTGRSITRHISGAPRSRLNRWCEQHI